MLRDLADWNVSAFLGGRGKLAKYFRRCSAEDAVILLLPTVRMRFIVQPAEWIDWMFVAVPVRAETSDKVVIFRIEHSGWPTDVTHPSVRGASSPGWAPRRTSSGLA